MTGALQFGVYPWAAPGAVSAVAPQVPDVPDDALAAAHQLAGAHSLTVHLYGQYTGVDDAQSTDALLSDASWWSQNGLRVEMVLRYRPATPALDAGFPAWVSSVSAQLARLPGLRSIQVGNEANNSSSPAAGDGAYPGAVAAVANGVPAARQALDGAGRADVGVGFNWAAGETPCGSTDFFAALRRVGGSAFTHAVDWVGIDVYPGTWSPPSPRVVPTPSQIATTVTGAISCLRSRHMPEAGLGPDVGINVTETGYPTDAARTPALQAQILRETVASVEHVRARDGVVALSWFSLRDGNSTSDQLENGYGLMNDAYAPKPAFSAYQQLIAREGA